MDPNKNISTTETFTASETLCSITLIVVIAGIVSYAFLLCNAKEYHLSKTPLVTVTSIWDITGKGAKEVFQANVRAVIKRGFEEVGASQPFRIWSDQGEMLILPPSHANVIRNVDALSHGEFMKETTCAELNGFEPYFLSTGTTLLIDMTKARLMSAGLERLSLPLSRTCSEACNLLFPSDNEWHEVVLKEELLDLVARLSSAMFLGDEEVRRDPTWLKLTKEYTVDSFIAARQLRMYPRFLWPLIAKFLPQAQRVRAQLQLAESIIGPIIERRRAEKAQSGTVAQEKYDSIAWVEQVAEKRGIKYSPPAMQLTLALSAIHTTTDLLTTTMYEILQHPGTIEILREEAISVISDAGGLKHSSLYSLRIMDGVLKEAQRIKPPLSVNMVRKSTDDIDLPNGFRIPKGTRLGVSSHAAWDPDVFPSPEKFDPYRFVRLREQPGQENAWQLTTTRPEHIAFGHGQHACPGRFLAANELKIALCHLLLKYDWEMSSATTPKAIPHGLLLDSDPTVKVKVRGRPCEVELP